MTYKTKATLLNKKKPSQQNYDEWMKKHKFACKENYEGNYGEADAVRMWERSVERKHHYLTYIGDGDCSVYNAVCKLENNAQHYGQEKENKVLKEE